MTKEAVTEGSRHHKIDAAVGLRIRLRRQELGMSQNTLGDALGVTFQQVQKYEKGWNRVSASRLWDMAVALSVPVAYFYTDVAESAGGETVVKTPLPVGSTNATIKLVGDYNAIRDANVQAQIRALVMALAQSQSNNLIIAIDPARGEDSAGVALRVDLKTAEAMGSADGPEDHPGAAPDAVG